jgi:hypothetical protein
MLFLSLKIVLRQCLRKKEKMDNAPGVFVVNGELVDGNGKPATAEAKARLKAAIQDLEPNQPPRYITEESSQIDNLKNLLDQVGDDE